MATILVVEDDEAVRSFLVEALATTGHTVTAAVDGEDGWRQVRAAPPDLVLTDVRMPRLDGLSLLRRIKGEHPGVEVIVLTAFGAVDQAVEAMKLGAFDYLQKPVESPARLRALAQQALRRAGTSAGPDDPPLTWGAPAMGAVQRSVARVAATEATVLLLGESGVGKEVVARAIHRRSVRASGPFTAVNCASLSESLLESELFGHERGAFTGAVARRVGRVEAAAGGTFFLDEVGELAPPLQARLLRLVQERRFERVGGNTPIVADVRWIAATNRDLTEMVARGAFRADLYHRLAVFPIRIPALRERREDIPPLVRLLMAEIAAELRLPTLDLEPAAEAAIAAAAWPGNVRELRNVLERAAILSGGRILVEHLDGIGPPAVGSAPAGSSGPAALDGSLADLERTAIAAALERQGGNRRRTAEQLGIGLRTLYEKLKVYGLG